MVALSSPPAKLVKRSSVSLRVYQTSRKRIAAALVIVVRYAAAAARAAARCSLRRLPLPRAAATKLATSRLRAPPHGARRGSSEAVRSNKRRRSGAADTPQVDKHAAPP